MSKAILFINGEIDIDFCSSYIDKNNPSTPVFCADGAFNKICESEKLLSRLVNIIGDGDSVIESPNHINKYILISDQNSTDFEKSLDILYEKNYTDILVFGASGGEMDHCLSNISIIMKYRHKINITFIDKYSYYFLLSPTNDIMNIKGKMVSLVPLFELKNINTSGCMFEITNGNLSFGSNTGIRNHAIENNISITYDSGDGLIFISHDNYHSHLEE